jgi:CBS domain-containing protein
MDEISARYLDSFNAIEKWLRDQVPSGERYDFPALIDIVGESHHGVRRQAGKLKDLNRFRNFVVHDFSQKKALAVPTKLAADVISAIRNELLSPEPLLSYAAKPVATCRPSEPITIAVQKMREGKFSQIPVCDAARCLGVLTAETIARWLSIDLAVNGGLVEERPIVEVMAHQEDPENHMFVPRTATADDALAAFQDFLGRGKRLEAILITERGHSAEGILGIVTVHDVPSLSRPSELN